MNRMIIWMLCGLATYAPVGIAHAAYIETFATDNAGWDTRTITNSRDVVGTPATWQETGGNTDGHITANVDSSPERLYTFGTRGTSLLVI